MIKRNVFIYPWDKLTEYDVDQLIIKHMDLPAKINWLEINCPKTLEAFFKEDL